MQFHFNNTSGDRPHMHFQEYRNGRWRDGIAGTHRFHLYHKMQIMKRAEHNGLRFEIVEDNPDVGFYLYVYEGDRCIADYLQNDEERCKQFAYKEYGVQPSLWQEVPEPK